VGGVVNTGEPMHFQGDQSQGTVLVKPQISADPAKSRTWRNDYDSSTSG
jgi:hypothetical protein